MEAIYADGTYLDQNPDWHVEDSAWKAGQVLGLLRREGVAPRTLAEVGCGAGEILRVLHDSLPETELEGWEISPQARELCRTRETERLHFRTGDLTELAAEGSASGHGAAICYDVLLCLDVFEHVPDHLGFLRRLKERAVLKVFHIPLDMTVWNVLRGQPIRLRERIGHLHYFDAPTALATLEECGYRILAHEYTAGSLDLAPKSGLRRLARFPRRLLRRLHPDLAARVLGGFSLLVLAE